MTKDKALEDLFLAAKPSFDNTDQFMPSLIKRLDAVEYLKQSIEHGRLAHAYLFEGEKGTGKHQESLWLAKRLYCTNVKDNEPCHACINCLRIENNEHPNVHQVTPDGQTIKVDQIRQLQTEFAKRGFEAGRQIFILSDAETMNVQAANSLLKFL